MAGQGPQVIDLSALAAYDGDVIDLDALSDSNLAVLPARRRRKRQRQQHTGPGAHAVAVDDDSDVQIMGHAQPPQRRRRCAARGADQPMAAAVIDLAGQPRQPQEPAEPDLLRPALLQQQPLQRAAALVLPPHSPRRRRQQQKPKGSSPQQPAELDPLQQASQQQAEQQTAWEAAVAAAGHVSSSTGECVICMEDGLTPQSMYRLGCGHEYCRGCLRQHVMSAVNEQKLIPRCPQPDCKAEIAAEALRGLLSRREWGAVLDVAAEAALPADQKLYCPYAACSALMVKGAQFGVKGTTACPHCKGRLCGECGKRPHPDADCAAAAAGADAASDAGVLALAQKHKWQRCPKCRTLVERLEGCNYMRCVFRGCNIRFCYQCGKQYTSTDHFSCCNPTTGRYALPPGYRHRRR